MFCYFCRDKGSNGSVRYRLSDETSNEHPRLFYIGAVSGELIVSKALDRETKDLYTVKVIAYDMGTLISLSSEVCLSEHTVINQDSAGVPNQPRNV